MAKLKYSLYYLDRKLELDRDKTYSLGRGAENDICLPGLTVSRKHARLFWEAGHFVIEDAKSTNGIFINGRRLLPRFSRDRSAPCRGD
jgi:pSer/pThr/pTyr-binding forkhead associated (FHA) protein